MRQLVLVVFFGVTLALLGTAHAQKENIQWYCSGDSKIDFSSGSPILSSQPVLPGYNANPESATYSDRKTGQLLFFTDGKSVWNRDLVSMPHGSLLSGDGSNYRGDVIDVSIVPMPGSNSKFFVFSAYQSNILLPDLGWTVYSIVDMSLDSGRGDVIVHNAMLAGATAFAGLGATWHSNGCAVWILCHSIVGSQFYSFLLTPAGIDPAPVISQIGAPEYFAYNPFGSNQRWYGQPKFNVQGNRVVSDEDGNVELFDFDNRTGILSNPLELETLKGNTTPTFAFSPGGKRLYVTSGNNNGSSSYELSQFDLSSNDRSIIPGTRKSIYSKDNGNLIGLGSMQLGVDGKIYFSHLYSIRRPDSLGLACAFDTILFVTPHDSIGPWIRQNIIDSPPVCAYHEGKCDTGLMADFVQKSTNCGDLCTDLVDRSTLPASSWQWSMPGGHPSTSTSNNPHVCYDSAGIYLVTLIATGATGTDTIAKPVSISIASGAVTLMQPTDTLVAGGTDVNISINYLLPPNFDVNGYLSAQGKDTVVYYDRMELGINYDDKLLTLPLAEMAARISADSGWQIGSIDSEAGILRIVLLDSGYVSNYTTVDFGIHDGILHLGTYRFTANSSKTDTTSVNLAYVHLETTQSSYGFCDNLETAHIARVIIQGDQGIGLVDPESAFEVHPNPSNGTIRLVGLSGDKSELIVFDVLGRQVYARSIRSGEVNSAIDIENLPNGSYCIRVANGNTVLTRRILLVK
jgi:PKD repeat protein